MRPKKTILCVDDNEQTLSVRKFMLETRGYRVLIASHGNIALELFRDGGIDLVLSDLAMPYMDGNELVRRMKEISPETPMILISGSIKDFDRADHADAFLPKGASTPLEMLERIRSLIARRRGPKKADLADRVPSDYQVASEVGQRYWVEDRRKVHSGVEAEGRAEVRAEVRTERRATHVAMAVAAV